LIFQPLYWSGYRQHGAEDRTRSLSKISLSSKVVKVRTGVIKLFHSILCSGELPKRPIPLKHLLVNIPMISTELSQAFGLEPYELYVTGDVKVVGPSENQRLASCFELAIAAEPDDTSTSYPSTRISTALPSLHSDYTLTNKEPLQRGYISKQRWTLQNKDRAVRYHEDRALKMINYGGQTISPDLQINFRWSATPDSPLIPTMSASLLLSFVLASIARYRPNLLDRVESSKVNLLCETFSNEADGFMLPAFRNLLYGQSTYFYSVPLT